jgi:pyruvate-formate lyase-activating enzyme
MIGPRRQAASPGDTSAACSDPIEKKPFFHAHPALAYSFGMLGCDLHCSHARTGDVAGAADPAALSPRSRRRRGLVADARALGAQVVVSIQRAVDHGGMVDGDL